MYNKGAAGGVGSVALALLRSMGVAVVASTRRPELLRAAAEATAAEVGPTPGTGLTVLPQGELEAAGKSPLGKQL